MKRSSKLYCWGLAMMVIGGASLADFITDNMGSFPISAVIFGLGFVLVLMSYVKEKR